MNEQSQVPQLFEDNSQLLAASSDAAAVARATQEIQAALVIAQRMGRDEIRAKARIIKACERRELAEVAEYEYTRGGTRITGPTIDLLRAIAARWGNIRYGWTEIERRGGASVIRAFAWDLYTNTQAERTFSVKHWRDTQGGGYALEDERDIYELLANQASRRVRACLEEVIDPDMVDVAIDQCHQTLKSGHAKPLADRATAMLVAFGPLGVTQEMIEQRIGNKLSGISENQIASLQRVYKSLKDGVGRVEDYFKPVAAKPEFGNAESRPQSEAPAPKPQTQTATPLPPPPDDPAEVAAGLAPEPPEGGGFNPVKAVRGLCKMAKVKEGVLVGYLADIGATDGSCATLEEVQMTKPGLLTMVSEQWPQHLDKLKAAGAAK